jgi:hypothetical protein
VTGLRGWFRSNAWALLAVAVLGTGAVLYSFAFDWQNFRNREPHEAVDIPRGEEGQLAGGTFALTDLVVLEGDSDDGRQYGVDEGTDVVVADLRITPDPEGSVDDYVTCDIWFHAPSPDGEREWWASSSNPTTYPEPEVEAYNCNIGGGPAYDLRLYFTVPAGGAEDGFLLVSLLEELPRALRLH